MTLSFQGVQPAKRGRAILPTGFLLLALVAGCSSSGPAVTGLGASGTAWSANHGSDYSSIVDDSSGHVEGYILAVSGTPLSQAEALVLRDLPSDARASAVQTGHGVEGTVCEVVEYTSPTLGGLLGGAHGDQVTAAFSASNATVMDPAHVARIVVDSANLRPTAQVLTGC